MAPASGMRLDVEFCVLAKKMPSMGVSPLGIETQNACLMRAFSSRSHAVQQNPICCVGLCGTPFLPGRRGLNLLFLTSADGGHIRQAAAIVNPGWRLPHRRAQVFAKAASGGPDVEPVKEVAVEPQVKLCPDCEHSKLLVDFEKTVTSMDGRTDVCRACLAHLRATSMQRELHHLGISVTEAWERAKACKKCGLVKELRDFAVRSKDQTQAYCRACTSALHAFQPQFAPTDQEQRCVACGQVQAADQFYPAPKSPSGRRKQCKSCFRERNAIRIQIRMNTRIFLSRETKRCSACGKQKHTSEFNAFCGAVDGLQHECRSCVHVGYRKRREANQQKRDPETGLWRSIEI